MLKRDVDLKWTSQKNSDTGNSEKKKQPIVGIYNLITKPVELFTLLAKDNNYNL